jgi:hypothetical protein
VIAAKTPRQGFPDWAWGFAIERREVFASGPEHVPDRSVGVVDAIEHGIRQTHELPHQIARQIGTARRHPVDDHRPLKVEVLTKSGTFANRRAIEPRQPGSPCILSSMSSHAIGAADTAKRRPKRCQTRHKSPTAGILDNASCQIASNREPLSRPILTPWRHESSGPGHRDNQDENAARGKFSPGAATNAPASRLGWLPQERFLNRQLVLSVSTISQCCVSRSSMAVVILASPNTWGQSAKARFVVISSEVFS